LRPAVATVLSPRPWEPRLAAAAIETGLVRLVGRCFNPPESLAADAVVVGSETSWLSTRVVAGWRRSGRVVIGIYPRGDRPAIGLLCGAGVDQLFAEDADPLVVLRAVRDLVPIELWAPIPAGFDHRVPRAL